MQLPFEPMLLHRAEQPFADAGWLYQVKWDGVRNLTEVSAGQVRHWSRRLRERTPHYPELNSLGAVFGSTRVVLDGEIIVLRNGKPSFAGILEREQGKGPPDRLKLQSAPATLMLFDLLEHGDSTLYSSPLEERLDLLRRMVPDTESWQVVSSFPGTAGPDLFKAVVEKGLEGVVGKRLGSAYSPGQRTHDWLKVKRRQQMLAVVCGYTAPVGRPGGLLLGAYRNDRLHYIGRVGSGIAAVDLMAVRAHLSPAACPFDHAPSFRDRFSGPPGPVVWVEPRLTLLVAFTEWTEDAKLRDPVVTGFSTEHPEAAVFE